MFILIIACNKRVSIFTSEQFTEQFQATQHQEHNYTVLPAKSDSGVMFRLQSYQGFIIDRSIDLCKLKWSVQVNVLLNNCKQNITPLLLLVGTSVALLPSELIAK